MFLGLALGVHSLSGLFVGAFRSLVDQAVIPAAKALFRSISDSYLCLSHVLVFLILSSPTFKARSDL